MLLIRLEKCECPTKHKQWYYEYTGQEKEPFVFSGDKWSLRLGKKKAKKVAGLVLSQGKARDWAQHASSESLKEVTTAYVDGAAVHTGAAFLLPSLKILACDPEITQADLEKLCARFPSLVGLDISECNKVTHLRPLAHLSQLKVLAISQCENVEDLEPLAGLTALVNLRARGCTGILELEPLSNLGNLKVLDLGGCEFIFDAAPLARLSRLGFLSLRDCTIPRKGLEALGGLSGLKGLCLPPDIMDEQLEDICQAHPNLEFLSLRGCWRIANLKSLCRLPRLKIIQIDNRTWLSDTEIEELKQEMPGSCVDIL